MPWSSNTTTHYITKGLTKKLVSSHNEVPPPKFRQNTFGVTSGQLSVIGIWLLVSLSAGIIFNTCKTIIEYGYIAYPIIGV